MKGIAVLLGAFGTAMGLYGQYNKAPGDFGDKFVFALTGYHATGANTPELLVKRNMASWGPLLAGSTVSMAAAKTGVNRKLPKGINL